MRTVTRPSPHAGRPSKRLAAIAIAAIVGLGTAASALAAQPKSSARFAGFITTLAPINGFKAPVTFAVSSSATTLLNFKYASFGCFGAGGFQPGVDYYTKPQATIKVGTVKVSKSGRFSAAGAVSTFTGFGQTTKTTSRVSGSFTSAKSAKGTITFSQKISGKYTSSCGPATIAFTAKAK